MHPRGQCDTGGDAGSNETARQRADPGQPGRVRVRSLAAARAAAVAILLAVAALLALPLQAQSAVLVSNLGQTNGSVGSLGSFDQAQAFTTGNNNGGYTLTSVEIQTTDTPNLDRLTVSIRSDSSGSPDASLGTLTNPASLPSDGLAAFTASGAGIDLEKETTYFVLVDVTGGPGGNIQNTASDNEDANPAANWSIGDNSLYRNKDSNASWTSFADSKKIRINGTLSGTTPTNNAPVFSSTTADRTVAENTAAGQNVGANLTATDADGDTLTYTLEGTDAASFDLDTTSTAGSARIQTKSGVTYNHEVKSSYSVTVKADDATDSDTIAVTITITDVTEAPGRPAAPMVSATSGSTTSLDVSWTAPTNTGPDIDHYDLRYREGTSGSWTNGPQDVTGTSAAIGSLMANTSYQVQVRATSDEGDSQRSPSGSGTTGAPTNNDPTFTDGTSTSRIFNETIGDTAVSTVSSIGPVVEATDTDTGDTLAYSFDGGTDDAKFGIVTTSSGGQIQTKVGEKYDREAKASYAVVVKVVDGNGGSDTIAVTLNVTDQNEPPLKPNQPSAMPVLGEDTQLAISWSDRTNTGRPDIDNYDLRYQKTTETAWTNGPQNVSGGGVQIHNLVPGTEYRIQIRATNNEGDSAWSNSRTASTSGVLPVTVKFEQMTSSVAEGGTVTVKVILSADPERTVTIPIEPAHQGGATTSDYFLDATAVAISSGNMEGTVVFSATDDRIDDDGESVTLSFGTLPAGVTAGSPDAMTVSITDNDTAGVTVSETSLTVTEENTTGDTYTVVLDSQPTANVTISINGQVGTDVGANPTPLPFTTLNWETAQTVTVTAGDDADLVNDTVTLTHAATSSDGDYSGITIANVVVTVEDNDTAKVTGLMVDSGNAQLVVQWTAVDNATGYQVQWKSGGQGYNNNSRRATVTTTSYTIPSLTNGTEYTVRVRATRTGATAGEYSDEVDATPVEPTSPGVTVSTMAVTVTEQDTTGDTYTVVLDTLPTATVTITVAGHSGTDVTPTPTTLTFTTGNWSTAQTVTVTAGNDGDTTNDSVTLTHSATSTDTGYSGIMIEDVEVTVEDNDTAQVTGLMVEPGNAQLVVEWTEVDNATGYEVQWKSGGQSYNTSGRQATIASGTTTSHTIPSLTNDTEYTVRVRATRTGFNAGPYSDEEMETPEMPTAQGVTVSKTTLTVTEADATGDTYTVVLDTQPTATVTITVTGHMGTDVTPTPATLTFTTGTWGTAQAVTVTAGNDGDTTNDSVTLTHSATSTDSAYSGITIAAVTVTVTDATTPPLPPEIEVPADWSLKPASLTSGDKFRLIFLSSTKRDASSTNIADYNTFVQTRAAAGHADIQAYSTGFRVVGCTAGVDARDNTATIGAGEGIYWLNGAKVADNYADFYDGDWSNGNADKNQLGSNGPDTSQSANYPLTGCDHDGTEDLDGGTSYALGESNVRVARPGSSATNTGPLSSNNATGISSTRPMYGLSQVFEVAAASGTPGVTVSPTTLTVMEQDATGDTYTVVLDTQPTATVTVTVAGHANTDVTPMPTTLTFTTGNWQTARTVTVKAGNDTNTANETVSLTHTAASSDTNYEAITIDNVTVMVTDNDVTTGPATGNPVILGTFAVGETLTADTSRIADPDGLMNVRYTYQWIRVDGSTETDISGATSETYTLNAADLEKKVRVKVRFTDDAGNPETRVSDVFPAPRTGTTLSTRNTPPVMAIPPVAQEAAAGAVFTYVIPEGAFTDADGDPLTYAATLSDGGALPAWLTFDEVTRTFTGMPGPGDGGTVRVTVTVSDGTATVPYEFTLTVTVPNTPPEVAKPLADQTAAVDVPFTYVIPADAFTDADGDPLTYAAALSDGGALPAWLAFDPATRTFTGAPAPDDSGTVRVTVTASDGSAYASDEFSLRVLMVIPSTLRAWTSRFGRTVATHVTDAVGARLRPSPEQEDSHVTVGGYRLPLGRHAAGAAGPDATDPETTIEPATATDPATTTKPETATDRLAALLTGLVGQALGLGPVQPEGGGLGADPWADQPGADPRLGQSQTLQLPTVRVRDVLLGSSFRLTLGEEDDVVPGHLRLTAWGRVAGTQFNGRDGDLTLDGDVLTGTVGVDSEWDRLLAGLAVSHSLGSGSFSLTGAGGAGDFDTSTLTSIHPYLRYAVNERVAVWSVLGYGWGDMTLEPGTGGALETDTTLLMGSFGGRGILLAAGEGGGYQLATRADAMLTRMTSDAVGGFAETEADAHRLRLVLEGTRDVTWPEGQRVTPTVELGVRHDWGDAETGFGLELGGRVQYADPTHGLTIEAAVRGLLAHEDSDYQEWGASGTIRLDPGPTGQGLALTLTPAWGAVSSGVESLWSRQTTAGLAPQGRTPAPTGQLNAQIGYGLWLPSAGGLMTPFTAVTFAGRGGSRSRVGLTFDRPATWAAGLRLELAAERIATASGPPEHTIGLQLQFQFGNSGQGPTPDTPRHRRRRPRAIQGQPTPTADTAAPLSPSDEVRRR